MPQTPVCTATIMARPLQRPVLAFAAAALALLVVAIVAMTPGETTTPRTSIVEDGGLAWNDVSIIIEDDELTTVDASVELADSPFAVAGGPEDRFVTHQLTGGRSEWDGPVATRPVPGSPASSVSE